MLKTYNQTLKMTSAELDIPLTYVNVNHLAHAMHVIVRSEEFFERACRDFKKSNDALMQQKTVPLGMIALLKRLDAVYAESHMVYTVRHQWQDDPREDVELLTKVYRAAGYVLGYMQSKLILDIIKFAEQDPKFGKVPDQFYDCVITVRRDDIHDIMIEDTAVYFDISTTCSVDYTLRNCCK